MSNLIIKATPEEIRNKASQLEREKGVMESLMNDMKARVTTLNDSWKSTSGINYVEKYNNVTKEITASLDRLTRQIQELRSAADILDRAGEKITGDVNSLSTNKMF